MGEEGPYRVSADRLGSLGSPLEVAHHMSIGLTKGDANSMSDVTEEVTPSTAIPAFGEHYIEMPSEDDLICKVIVKGKECGFKAKTPAGKTRHNTRQHVNKKKNWPRDVKKKELTPLQKKQASIPNLMPVWADGNGRIVLVDPNGDVWRATKMDVV